MAGSASALSLSVWHIACTCLLSGCLFVEEAWRPEVDEPPIIISPVEEFTVLTMHRAWDLVVMARDPEGEPVSFLWTAPEELGAAELFTDDSDEDEVIYFSKLRVPYDPRYDNEEIRVLITDGELQNTQSRTWFLEVE